MALIRPAFLDNMSWEMAEVYGAVNDQILINLAKYFPYWTSSTVPKSSFEYQASMLAQMGQVNRETIQIIRRNLKNADDALQNVLEQAIMESVSKSEPELLNAVKKGILKPASIPTVSPNQYRAFQLYYQQAANKLNLVNTVMLESTKQAYQATVSDIVARVQATQTALDIGTGEVVTGVSSWNTAMVHSINRMKQNGITGFIDHGGHHWSAEAYTAMDIRTTVANTARSAVWEVNQDFGNDLYIVSYHDGARPLCYPYQNKVISSSDRFGVTYDLDGNEIPYIAQSATTYGQPAGLFGINCKHYPTPFIPGVSIIRGEPQSPEENEKAYEESQKQRALERKIREEKRDLMMLKAQGAPDEIIKAQRAKIRETDDQIDAFCDETGRARRQNREGVYTQRSFPDPDTYDVNLFEQKQKDEIEKYFTSGGSQQGYTFGQMTPKEPIITGTPTPTPVPQNVAQQVTQTPPPVVESQVDTFTPAKTTEDAAKYAKDHFANMVKYTGDVSLDALNEINKELTELTGEYPIDKLNTLMQNGRMKTANARANGGLIEFKGSVFTKRTGVYDAETYRASARQTIERLDNMFPNGVPDWYKSTYKNAQEKIKFSRWSISSEYGTMVATIPHEYGHVLSDQYFGLINGSHYCKTAREAASIEKCELVKKTFKLAKKNGDIYKLSEYASTNYHEFFAESFAARWVGEKLPDYIEDMFVKVLGK